MAIEIVSFPIQNGGSFQYFPVRYVAVYQAGYPMRSHQVGCEKLRPVPHESVTVCASVGLKKVAVPEFFRHEIMGVPWR